MCMHASIGRTTLHGRQQAWGTCQHLRPHERAAHAALIVVQAAAGQVTLVHRAGGTICENALRLSTLSSSQPNAAACSPWWFRYEPKASSPTAKVVNILNHALAGIRPAWGHQCAARQLVSATPVAAKPTTRPVCVPSRAECHMPGSLWTQSVDPKLRHAPS